jgi:hypothetical protein
MRWRWTRSFTANPASCLRSSRRRARGEKTPRAWECRRRARRAGLPICGTALTSLCVSDVTE